MRSRRKKEKDNNKIIFIILGGIIAVLIFYIFYISNEHDKTLRNISNNSNIETVNKLKKDNRFDYVYEGSYVTTFEDKVYDNNDRVLSYSDITVPYVNIATAEADSVNNQIKQYYDKVISVYENLDDDEYITLNYWTYINNNTLSIILITNRWDDDGSKRTYTTYNISLEDGTTYDFNELLNTFNLKKEYIIDSMKENIENYVEEEDYDEEYIDTNMELFEEKLNEGSLSYFVNPSNKITIILPIENSDSTSGNELMFIIN